MKKLGKVFSAILSLCVASSFTACDGGSSSNKTDKTDKDSIAYCGFESWEDGFQLVRFLSGFGRISVNTDERYVKSGKQSARIDPLGWEDYYWEKATFYMPTVSSKFDFDYSDFTYVKSVDFSMYNPQNEDKTMFVGLASNIMGLGIDKVHNTKIVLHPGWNDCSMEIDGGLITVMDGKVDDVKGIYFSFYNAVSMNVTENTDYYYLDDVEIVKKTEQNSTTMEISVSGDEICSFEKPWQKYMLSTDNPVDMEIVKASDYGITATDGTHVLRTVWKNETEVGSYDYVRTGGWQYFLLSKELLEASKLKTVEKTDADKTFICFDVYNATEEQHSMAVRYRIGGEYAKGEVYYTFGTATQIGNWVTYECKVSDILAKNPDFLKKPGSMEFALQDKGTDREFFIDNIRVECRY